VPIRALVFDFDGLILETEVPVLESWRREYEALGMELPVATWLETIGTADHEFDPLTHLEQLTGRKLDHASLTRRRKRYRDALLHAQDTLPGVREWIRDARAAGLKLGVASSSSRAWVAGHLSRLGLGEGWDTICCADDVQNTKPDPALYLLACANLGVAPAEALALEDSMNGVKAAHAAGMRVAAVPATLTARMDFSEADLVLESLAAADLAEVRERLGA
jgi:HAD superfamily hydrolase (TIGR01509 family)